jgi:hypothetical protein
MGRKTVARIINKNKEQRENGNNPIKPKKRVSKEKKLDAFDSQIKELIKKYPNISGKRMFEELVSNGFDGSISLVRQHLRRIRPTSKKEPTPRFETDPGVHYGKNVIMVRKSLLLLVASFLSILSQHNNLECTLHKMESTVFKDFQANPGYHLVSWVDHCSPAILLSEAPYVLLLNQFQHRFALF